MAQHHQPNYVVSVISCHKRQTPDNSENVFIAKFWGRGKMFPSEYFRGPGPRASLNWLLYLFLDVVVLKRTNCCFL